MVAVCNSIGGTVRETEEALAGIAVSVVASVELEIRHNLYRLLGVSDGRIRWVASHEQALRQTRRTRARCWPGLAEVEVADTAIATRWLAEGRLPADVAVICGEGAGRLFGLVAMAEDIQDGDSLTEFHMVALAPGISGTEA